jgi:hypothetical protein
MAVLPVLLVASTSGAVTNVDVSISNQVVADQAIYTITFTLGADMGKNDTYTITFPTGTVLPTVLKKDEGGMTDLTTDGVDQLAANAVIVGQALTIKHKNNVAGSFLTGHLVQIVLGIYDKPTSLVTNPATQAIDYTLTVETNNETTPVESSEYTIVLANMTAADLSLGSNVIDATPSYEFSFSTSKMVLKDEWFHIVMNASTTVSTVRDKNDWRINGDVPKDVRIVGQQIKLKVDKQVGIAPGEVTLSNIADFIITNPSTPSSQYTVGVFTATNEAGDDTLDGLVTSNPYTIHSTTTPTLGDVSVTPTTVSALAEYRISSTNLAAATMVSGDVLTYTFPSGTVVPPSISTDDVTLTHDATGVTISSVETNPTNRTIAITLGATLAGSGPDTLTVSSSAGVANPSTFGDLAFEVTMSTNLQPSAGTSNSYSITTSSTLTPSNVVPEPNTFKSAAEYSIGFSVGDAGALTSGSGTVTIVFPNDTQVPASIATSKVTVNSVAANAVTTTPGSRLVTITTGSDVANNASVEIVIDASAGIVNPTTTGSSYSASVNTSAEGAVASNIYTIVQSMVSEITVTPQSPQPLIGTPYTVDFYLGAGGALTAGSSSITMNFHDSVTVSGTMTANDIEVNGTSVVLSPTLNTGTSTITITSPVSVGGSGAISIVIGNGITNPTLGTYDVIVNTSIEETEITSVDFSINSGTSVIDPAVSLDTYAATGSAIYSVSFTANNAMQVIKNKKNFIYVNLPDEVDASGLDKADIDVTTDGSPVTVSKITHDASSQMLTLEIGSSINQGDDVIMLIDDGTNNVTNPSVAAGDYYVKVHTSGDANALSTAKFAITTSTAYTSVSVTPAPTTANTIAAYTIDLTSGANTRIAAGIDTITVGFPETATVPATILTSALLVNGAVPARVSVEADVSDTWIHIVPSAEIAASTAITISISSSAEIRNPGTAGDETWKVYSTVQPTQVSDVVTISAITNVSSASVTPSPSTAGVTSEYTISFTMGGTALVSGDTIHVTFPEDTGIPSSVSESSVTLEEETTSQTITSVSASPSNRKISVIVGEAVAAGSSLELTFLPAVGINNPSTANNGYTLTVAATDNGSAGSNVYTISSSQIDPATVTPSPTTASAVAEYTVDFNVGGGGALTSGASSISIHLPVGTTVPTFIEASDVTVNGVTLASSPSVDDRDITLTSPVNVVNSGPVSVVFSSAAGIENPSIVSTGYTVKAHTSKETTEITSLTFSITRGTDVSEVVASPASVTAGAVTAYSVSFKAGTGDIVAGNLLYVIFPNGTTIPSSITNTNVTLDGVASSAVFTDPDLRKIRVTANTTVSGSATTTLAFNGTGAEGITNPTASSQHTMSLRVDSTSTPVGSSRYSIVSTTELSSVVVTPSPLSSSATAAYTISAQTTSDGALVVGDTITVVFATGTTIPSSIAASAISVDGVGATYAAIVDQGTRTVQVLTPSAIGNSSTFSLSFSATASIQNPVAGSNTSDVYTNVQPTPATSGSYVTAASADVTSSTVSVSPTIVGLTASYDLSFSLGTTALSSGDVITVTFPEGTTVPATIDTSAIDVEDDGVLISEHATDGVTTNPTNRTVAIKVDAAVAASSAMTVSFETIAGIENPTTSGNSYTLDVAVTGNGNAISQTYSIIASTTNAATVTPSPTTENIAAEYTVQFQTGSGGALTAGSNTISITFPAGTTVPSTMIATQVTVNGTALVSSPSSNASTRVVMLTTPVSISANSTVTVVFSSSAGLENPTSGTNHSVFVSTTKEPSSTQSNVFTITSGSAVSSISAVPGTSTASSTSTYAITLTSGDGGITTSADTVYVRFPTGTTVPASITASNITLGGVAASEVMTIPDSRLVRILPGATISASTETTLNFNGTGGESITNPSTPGSNYTLTVRVDSLSSPIASSTYSIVSSTALTAADVTVSPSTSSSMASYTIATTTGADGALSDGDEVIVIFPSGTTVPSSITAGEITVNGTACQTTPTIDQGARQVTIYTPVAVSASSSLSLVFSTSAGIVNPTVGTTTAYALDTLRTSVQPVGDASNNYDINPATVVSSATVTPSPATISSLAQYTIAFSLGNTGSLDQNVGTITVIFPSGTTLPGTISKSNVIVNDVVADIVAVQNAVGGDADSIIVTVGATLAANASVDLVVWSAAGVTNPSSTGNYTLQVFTSEETTPVTSSNYTMDPSTVTSGSVSLNNQITGQQSTYTTVFSTGSAGALTSDVGTITLTLPDGTVIGGSVARTSATSPAITINTVAVANVEVSGQVITLTTPTGITAGEEVTVAISSGSGMISNPSTANNNYQVSVATSAETTPVTTSTYAVTASTTVTGVGVSLGSAQAADSSQYTVTFTTGASGALTGSDDIIITFPSGTTIGSDIARSSTGTPDITVNSSSVSTVTVDGLTVTITTPVSVNASTTVNVVFAEGTNMILNPTTTGSDKTVAVRTTQETDPISSSTFTINTTATTLTAAVVTVNPATESDPAAYTVSFSTGSNGAVRVGDTFTVTFPSGTTVPVSIAADNMRVNGVAPTEDPTVNVSSRIVTVKTPSVIGASTDVDVTFLLAAGIENPGTTAYYTLTARSSIEISAVTSSNYSIGTPTTPGNIVIEQNMNWSTSVAVSDSFRVLQVKLTASNGDIDITEIQLSGNGTGDDLNEVEHVSLYHDEDGDGTLDSPATVDTLIAIATFNENDGIVTFSLDTITIATSTNRYWIFQYAFGSTGVSGETFSSTIPNNTYLSASYDGTPLVGDSVTVSAAPITGGTLTMASAELTATGTSMNPSGIPPGGEDVTMMKVTMQTTSSNAVLESITIANTISSPIGTFDEADIDSVKIYLDNGNGTFSASEDELLGGNTITGGSGGAGTVTFASERLIGTTAATLFFTYDIADAADVSHSAGLKVTSISVTSPSTVASYSIETASESSLPVELSLLTTDATPVGVKIEWTTASEVNNLAWRVLRVEIAGPADTLALTGEKRAAKRSRALTSKSVGFLPGQGTTPWETDYSYLDASASMGTMYAYYLVDIDNAGTQTVHGPVFSQITGPTSYSLSENYPNPFNPTTSISFTLPSKSDVRLIVYNLLGQEIAVLRKEVMAVGHHKVAWHGRDESGRAVGSGVYFYRMTAVSEDGARTFTNTKKMLLVQ